MRRVVAVALTTALIPCACGLSGCGAGTAGTGATAGGSNAGLSQSELLARLGSALGGVSAMHMKGSVSESGSTVTVDMQLNRDGSAQGTMVSNGTTLPLIVVGGITYMQTTPSQSAATAGAGSWTKSSGSDNSTTSFDLMVQNLDSPSAYSYTYQGTSTVGGLAVAQYSEEAVGGGVDKVLSIPLTGPALPVSVDGGARGSFTFAWDQPTRVVAPPAADVATDSAD